MWLPIPSTESMKLVLASVTAMGAMLAETLADPKGWEDISLKVALGTAVYVLWTVMQKDRAEHKAEMTAMWAEHKKEMQEREERVTRSTEDASASLKELSALTKEQTEYFKTVTRNIIDERLHPKPNLP